LAPSLKRAVRLLSDTWRAQLKSEHALEPIENGESELCKMTRLECFCNGLPTLDHDRCTPDSCRLAATPKSAESGQGTKSLAR